MSESLAAWLYDHSGAAVAVCLLLTALAAIPALDVGVDTAVQNWFLEDDPALDRYQDFQKTYGNDEVVLIALQRADGMLTPEGFAIQREAVERLREVAGVADVRGLPTAKRVQRTFTGLQFVPLVPSGSLSTDQASRLRDRILSDSTYARMVGDDGAMTAVFARMEPIDVIDGRRKEILGSIRSTLEPLGASVHLAGTGVVVQALNEAATQDSRVFILASNVLIFVLLFVFFRRIGPVLVTLGVVGVATVWLMGLYGLAGRDINTVTLVMPTLVLVVCTADCVHILVHAGDRDDTLSARERAVKTVGYLLRPCAVTTLTTAAGFASLGVSSMQIVRDLGIFSAAGVLGGLVAALVGCTAALHFDWALPARPDGSYLRRAVDAAVDLGVTRWRPVLVAAVLAVGLSVAGASTLVVDTNSIGYLYPDHPVRQDSRLIEEKLGAYAPLEFIVARDSTSAPSASADSDAGATDRSSLGFQPEIHERILSWQRRALATGEVQWHRSSSDALLRLNAVLPGGSASIPPNANRIEGLTRLGAGDLPVLDDLAGHPDQVRVTFGTPVQSARGIGAALDSVQAAAAFPAGVDVKPSGYLPLYVRIMTLIVESQIASFGLALVVILLMIGLFFQSWQVALTSLLPNGLPVLLTLGVMGWTGLPLDVATVTIAAVIFGLVVDDTVHLLHHYVSVRSSNETAGLSRTEALHRGAQRGGRMLAMTTAVLAGGFLVLCTAHVRSVVWFGFLSSTAIGFAILADLVILPAVFAALERTP